MKVSLRKRTPKEDSKTGKAKKTSLYLDFYHEGKRKTQYLKMYLYTKPKNPLERAHNRKTLELAENIRAQRQLEMQNYEFGFPDKEKQKGTLIAYMRILADKKRSNQSTWGTWDSMIKHLKAFSPYDTSFSNVDRQYVQDFKDYLDKKARTKNEKKLSQNSKYAYFNKFKAGLKQALKDGIFPHNPAEAVSGFKEGESEREFLTLEELQAVAKAECDVPILKKAFLFSCLTGLRWSDINKMVWSEVQHSKEMGYYIRFRQKKTHGVETLPISEQAYEMLGEPQERGERVFKGLKYSDWYNVKLQQWVMRAGIAKTITFHCARHTYATLQLTMGTDIYTVSKLLGHRALSTTQIYAKVIDEKKKEAANKIKIDL